MNGMKGESRRSADSKTESRVVSASAAGVGRRLAEIETQLDDLQIPVAEIAPEEAVEVFAASSKR